MERLELIRRLLREAYDLSGTMGRDPFAGELPGMQCMDTVEEDFGTYFYITQKGMDVHIADDQWWPTV